MISDIFLANTRSHYITLLCKVTVIQRGSVFLFLHVFVSFEQVLFHLSLTVIRALQGIIRVPP